VFCSDSSPRSQSGQVEVHRGFSNQVAIQFPDEYFDFVYIDGDHRYAAVKEDLELYFKKLKVRGLLCGDDYAESGWWKAGVARAVDEFASNNIVKIVSLQHSQFCLEKTQLAAN
jgi:predicted O-methyltransferase YrrM